MFDGMVESRSDELGLDELRVAISQLNLKYNFGLAADDDVRLKCFCSDETGRITRDSFVTGVGQLGGTLQRIGQSLSLGQVKLVLMSAFDRFDSNSDGHINMEELAAAMAFLGVQISLEDIACLHRFLSVENSLHQTSLTKEPSELDKLVSVTNDIWCQFADRVNVDGVDQKLRDMCEVMSMAFGGNSARSKCALRTAGDLEELFALAEVAMDVIGVTIAARYFSEALISTETANVLNAAPFALFLGIIAARMTKGLDELALKDMSKDEALIYARLFHGHGFSQAQFQQLLACEGCRWEVAEPGEVLNHRDNSLKVIVKGQTLVKDTASPSGASQVQLPPGTSIGETLFFEGRRLWHHERVEAVGPVVYIAWDNEELRDWLDHNTDVALRLGDLLADTMATNLEVVTKLRRRGAVTSVDLPAHSQTVNCFDDASTDAVNRGMASPTDLWPLMPGLSQWLGLGATDGECRRLASYLEGGNECAWNSVCFQARMVELKACIEHLRKIGLTVDELRSVLQRSYHSIDTNSDGHISLSEFRTAISKLGLPFDTREVDVLYMYLEGEILPLDDTEESMARHSDSHVWSAFQGAMSSQAQRKGLARFGYFARKVGDALSRPGSPVERVQAALSIFWEGIDAFGDAANFTSDFAGVGAALYGMYLVVSGLAAPEDLDVASLAPFLLFLGISGTEMARHLTEGSVSDLSEREALLYVVAFEKQGFTIGEFGQFLGQAKWDRYEAGEEVVSANSTQYEPGTLRVVAQGSCVVADSGRRATSRVGSGAFLCGAAFSSMVNKQETQQQNDGAQMVRAEGPTTIASWSMESLRGLLARDPPLKMKLHRAITVSMASRLLDAYEAARTL